MAGRIDELAGQIDRLARVVEDLTERRQVVLELRSTKTEALLSEFARAIKRLGERLVRVDALGAELERLDKRVELIATSGQGELNDLACDPPNLEER